MTHAEATRMHIVKLAEGVMGWSIITHKEWATIGRNAREQGYKKLLVRKDDGSYYLGCDDEWNPWTDDSQAVELAEAWCGLKADVRGFMITSVVDPETGKRGYMAILRPGTEYAEIAFSLAAALTGAVCKALGLEVEEA